MPWSGGCLRRHRSVRTRGEDGGYGGRRQYDQLQSSATDNKRLSLINEEKRGHAVVELVRPEGQILGIVLTGGCDKGSRPKIANLAPGSIAYRSDALAVGDTIVAIDGIRTATMRHNDIVAMLQASRDKVVLDVEYEIPSSPAADASMCVCPKVIQVKLEKDNGSCGLLIRGGAHTDKLKSRPLTVINVRPNGPADREGTIKAGDRLIAVNNIHLANGTLSEALNAIRQCHNQALLTIEYDVSLMDAVRNATGPVLVEIDRLPNTPLGITLTQLEANGGIVIESIKQASIAERCGALHVGDQVYAIDGIRLSGMSAQDASHLLRISNDDVIRLEILPVQQVMRELQLARGGQVAQPLQASSYNSSFGTLSSIGGQSTTSSNYPLPPIPPHHLQSVTASVKARRSYGQRRHHSADYLPGLLAAQPPSSNASLSSVFGITPLSRSTLQLLTHIETTDVTLYSDPQRGLGIVLAGQEPGYPTIESIAPDSPAERSGVLQVGDRVISVNGRTLEGLSRDEANKTLQRSRPKVIVEIEFDVADSVVPSSGTFTVKLRKHATAGLGITITSPKNRRPGEPLLISDIRKGSVAHRTGTLQPGDKLLAIDSIRMDCCTTDDAIHILQQSDDIVKLRIRKDEAFSDEPDESVVFTVELRRRGGPLGITISGTEEPFDPIVISGLTEGGLAERTGALHIGDRILAINGYSLRGKPLSEAIVMLQNSGDLVTLKLSKISHNPPSISSFDPSSMERPKEPEPGQLGARYNPHLFGTPIPSVDSAVESWDSFAAMDASLLSSANNESAGASRGGTPLSPPRQISGTPPQSAVGPSARHVDHPLPPSVVLKPSPQDQIPNWLQRSASQSRVPDDTSILPHPWTKLAPPEYPKKSPSWSQLQCVTSTYNNDVKITKPEPSTSWSQLPSTSNSVPSVSQESCPNWSQLSCTNATASSKLPEPNTNWARLTKPELLWPSTPPWNNVPQPKTWSITPTTTTPSPPEVRLSAFEPVSSSHSSTTTVPSSLLPPDGTLSPPREFDSPKPTGIPKSSLMSSRSESLENDASDFLKVLEDLQTCGQSWLMRHIERKLLAPTSGHTPSTGPSQSQSSGNTQRYDEMFGGVQSQLQSEDGNSTVASHSEFDFARFEENPSSIMPPVLPIPIEVHRVTLFKDRVHDDFGFSVSDGVLEAGVFVNRVRPGGPAERTGLLKPYDRILQVNDTKTYDFDCCQTVPLIAASGDQIELVVSRPAASFVTSGLDQNQQRDPYAERPWLDDDAQSNRSSIILTKTL